MLNLYEEIFKVEIIGRNHKCFSDSDKGLNSEQVVLKWRGLVWASGATLQRKGNLLQ